MRKRSIICFFAIIMTLPVFVHAQEKYKDPDLPVDERVNDLVSRMTLEEKVSQMMNDADAIPRLGIPEYDWWNEALHGVARADLATVFPQAIGLAATWDPGLINEMAHIIGFEARAKYIKAQADNEYGRYKGLTMWSPNINILRDPRWGRGHETYGEDPFLTGELAKAFVRGLQGNDEKYLLTVSTPKHFAVHSGPEATRHEFNAVTSKRDLYDTYLPAFKAAVKDAGAYSVMCAYNRYLGVPCCGSELLLQKILREDWNFDGYVVSDCNAIRDISENHKYVPTKPEAAAVAVKAGTDLNCGSFYKYLPEAVEKDFITEEEIDVAVKRLFTARFKLGLFDRDENHPYNNVPYSYVDRPENRVKALEIARESMVLLKNEDDMLPLTKDIRKLAVIGPNADEYSVLVANYHGTPSMYYTALDGLRNELPGDAIIKYEPGCDLKDPDKTPLKIIESEYFSFKGKEGLLAEYFDNKELEGKPIFRRIDSDIDNNWIKHRISELDDINFSVRWTGELEAPVTGKYTIGLEADDGFRLFIDGEEVIDNWKTRQREKRKEVFLEKGKKYDLKVEYFQSGYLSECKMSWALPGKSPRERAIDIASEADAVIFVGGISPAMEGETGDKEGIAFPQVQRSLLKDLKQVNDDIVLVLNNGSALAVNWENEHIPAILEAWYPGEEGGTAITDIIFGDHNPSGRLPVTFYKSKNDLPPIEDYSMEGRTYRYFKGEPLFPFGYGLSYTNFTYSDPSSDKKKMSSNESAEVTITVRNDGDRAGEEVVQLYISKEKSEIVRPIKELRGIRKIHLEPGEEQMVKFHIDSELLGYTDTETEEWMVEPGVYHIHIGSASDQTTTTQLRIKK